MYTRPDVYVERVNTEQQPIPSVNPSVGAFVGIAPRGEIGVAHRVANWSDYVRTYARGLSMPFLKDSDLSYAVYGFFQNGGSTCYISRCASGTAAKASVVVPLAGLTFSAKDEGTWAKDTLKVEVVANATLFDVIISMGSQVIESFVELSNVVDSDNYYFNVINDKSNMVTVTEGTLAVGNGIMTGGDDGVSGIADADYLGLRGIKAFDAIERIGLLAIPGQTSAVVLQGVVDYCESRGDCFAILDLPLNSTAQQAKTAKSAIVGDAGATYFPWGKVLDPLSRQGKLRLCPPSGHVMGMYARTDSKRGVHKVPAGEEAQLKGFFGLESVVSPDDMSLLNPVGVNCIISKTNKGVIVWGGRSISKDPKRRYVSDVRLDINIETSCYDGTQWAVFEPNDEDLWGKLETTLKSFLYTKWNDDKALKGKTAEEAYYVKCDEELNTPESLDSGVVIAEIGYAKKRPAEFVVIRIVQKTASN